MIAKKVDPRHNYLMEIDAFPLAQRSELEGSDQVPAGRMSRNINRKEEDSIKQMVR